MRYKDIAIAFLIEAKDDLEMAEIALRESKFSKCVFHSQQSISIVILTYNSEKVLLLCIESIKKLRLPEGEQSDHQG